jgi:hypothetical protein
MTEAITYHQVFELIGIGAVTALILVPFYGMIWEISAARARREARLELDQSKVQQP